MIVRTYYNYFSTSSFSKLDKAAVFSKKVEDNMELYMKTETFLSSDDYECNCVNLKTGDCFYTEPDEIVFVPSAELAINW